MARAALGGYIYIELVRFKGVAVGISSSLQPFVVKVTTVDERIMRVKMKHTLGFIPLVAVYAPTEKCEDAKKEVFYDKLSSILDQCPSGVTLIVVGDY